MGRSKKYIQDDLIVKFKSGAITKNDIVNKTNYSSHTVGTRLRELGISRLKRKPKISKRNVEIFNKYQKGQTVTKLANDFSVSRQRIHQIVSVISVYYNLELRKPIRVGRHLIDINISKKIKEDYCRGIISSKQLAEKFRCSVSHVCKKLKLMGMEKPKVYKNNWDILYNRWIKGETAQNLSLEHNITYRGFYAGIIRYRRRNNLPGKRAMNRSRLN